MTLGTLFKIIGTLTIFIPIAYLAFMTYTLKKDNAVLELEKKEANKKAEEFRISLSNSERNLNVSLAENKKLSKKLSETNGIIKSMEINYDLKFKALNIDYNKKKSSYEQHISNLNKDINDIRNARTTADSNSTEFLNFQLNTIKRILIEDMRKDEE